MVIPRTGVDPDGLTRTEADHFGNCPVCGAFLDMRVPRPDAGARSRHGDRDQQRSGAAAAPPSPE